MIKKYIAYLWKRTNKLILVAFAICVLAYPIYMLINGIPYLNELIYWVYETPESEGYQINSGYFYYVSEQTLLFMPTILIMVASYIVPVVVQGTFQNKKRCDNLFSLPMKKQTQILVTSVYGLVATLAVWWLNALLGLCASFVVQLHYNVGYFFLYLLVMSILSIGVYGMSTLFASLATNVLDSILLLACHVLISVMIALNIEVYQFGLDSGFWNILVPITAANDLTCFFQQEVAFKSEGLKELVQSLDGEYSYRDIIRYTFSAIDYASLATFFVAGLGSFATSYLLWKKVRAEEMQSPSTKFYSYPLVFSVLMFLCFLVFGIGNFSEEEYLLINLAFITFYFVGTFIFQRKIKFTKRTIILFAVIFILANILSVVFDYIAPVTIFLQTY